MYKSKSIFSNHLIRITGIKKNTLSSIIYLVYVPAQEGCPIGDFKFLHINCKIEYLHMNLKRYLSS
jgi:hypothetical protein